MIWWSFSCPVSFQGETQIIFCYSGIAKQAVTAILKVPLMVTMPRNIIWPWQKSTSTLPSSRTINTRLKLRIITDSFKCITTETSEQILFPLKQNNQILQLTEEVYLYAFTVKEAAHADILPSIVLHFRNTTHVLYSWNQILTTPHDKATNVYLVIFPKDLCCHFLVTYYDLTN